MRIVFDVSGTLYGANQEKVRDLYNFLRNMKQEMYVWSSIGSYAMDAVTKLRLNAVPLTKLSVSDAKERKEPLMDVAIEDDSSQTYLAAKRIVLVSEIPEGLKALEKFARELINK